MNEIRQISIGIGSVLAGAAALLKELRKRKDDD